MAHLVEHRTGIAKVLVSNPIGALFLGFLCSFLSYFTTAHISSYRGGHGFESRWSLIILGGFIFNCLSHFTTAKISFTFVLYPQFTHIIIYHIYTLRQETNVAKSSFKHNLSKDEQSLNARPLWYDVRLEKNCQAQRWRRQERKADTPDETKSPLEKARQSESRENPETSDDFRDNVSKDEQGFKKRENPGRTYGLLCFGVCESLSKNPINATKIGKFPNTPTLISGFNMRARQISISISRFEI